jgi:5-methylcytosine-specific restriction protein A
MASPTRQRQRGSSWMTTRARILYRDPLCIECKRNGWVTASTECDHITPIVQGGEDNDENLQGLCHDCHAAKTKAEEAARRGQR